MLSSSISLIQWHTIHGSPCWTLMCFWVSRHWWGSGHRGQGSMGGAQPCPIACTPRGGKIRRREEGRQELPSPHHLRRLQHHGPPSWWGLRPSVPHHLQPWSRWHLNAFQLSHLLLTNNNMVFCFYFFSISNQPKTLSYRLPSKPATFPICWRQPHLGLAFWDHECTVSHCAGGKMRAGKPRQGGGTHMTIEICSLNHPKKQPKTFLLTHINDLLCLICICVMFIPWHCR